MARDNFDTFCRAFGKRVKELRLEHGWTQEDMTEFGFALRQYQRIEAGCSVTLRTLWKLAEALEVNVTELLPPGP